MAGAFVLLSHTADTGIAVTADSLRELFEWAAVGMFSTMFDLAMCIPERHVTVAATGTRTDELLVDVLADLLYLSEAEDVVPCSFQVDEIWPNEVDLSAGVAPLRPNLLIGPPIKAVTYHDLDVSKKEDGTWTARVVFDV